ncbi:MAG: BamA/TamA family outer membrane protein [Bacteroidota bacterium]
MKLLRLIVSLFIFNALVSCSATKGLEDSEKLFCGTSVSFEDEENMSDRNSLMREIRLSYLKKNNSGIFNIKTGFYNWFDSTATSGWRHGIKYKIGAEPIVFKKSMVRKTQLRLENLLVGSGYLKSKVTCTDIEKNRRIKIDCEIKLNDRFRIDSVFYPSDTLPMTKELQSMYKIDFLKSGDFFQRKNIIKDRDAFVDAANNNGFPFVTSEDILFIIDTTKSDNKVDVHMQIKSATDSMKYKRYRYGNFYINPNFSLSEDLPTDTSEMIRKENYSIKEGYDFLKEKSYNKAMYITEGRIYNESKSKITSNRLLNLGLFKFVNIKTRLNENNRLDHYFNLTPFKMESVTFEIDVNNRSGNFWGSSLKASYVNRNIFGGAERFEISLSGGAETEFGDPFINTSDIALVASLTMPSIVLPFRPFKTFRTSLPKTFMSLGFNRQTRFNFYSFVSANAKYGFKWNETQEKSSFLVPLDLQWFNLLSTTTEFDSVLVNDVRLANSFETTVALGWSYEYVYNKRNKYNPINQFYFKGTFESSGNILYGFKNLFYNNPSSTFLGVQYAQYIRLTTDIRKYWAMDVGSIASRFVVGTAFAWGNSSEVPYAKQYSVGGSNDLRAFRLRRIGPGSFVADNPNDPTNQFLDQTGDIKIEANVEYRFPILGFFKGAFFVDAGNVWLLDNPQQPEGEFSFSNFYNQIAVGTGFGFRFDFENLVFRLDLAFPVRTIDTNGNFNWVLNDVDFFNSSWRSDNLIYNLGIGYPF